MADQFSIKPGDEIDWIPAGDAIRVVKRAPAKRRAGSQSAARLRLFDEASRRQQQRQQSTSAPPPASYQLGWFDAQIWAYAEHFGLDELWTEDFQDGRLHGSVRVRNPFAAVKS